jgi:hypothetical protein
MSGIFVSKKEKRKRPGQRRKGWTEPTKIKETRKAEAPCTGAIGIRRAGLKVGF